MRRFVLLATSLLATFVWAQTHGADNKPQTAGQDAFHLNIAIQVQEYKSAFAKSAPGRCEKSHAEFVRIGEYPDETTPSANAQGTNEDSYGRTLAAQVDAYQSIWAAIKEPDTRSAGFQEVLPGSMASNAEAQSAEEDFFSQTVAAQFMQNRLAKAVIRL